MEQNEDLSPAIEEVLASPPTETSLRLQVTDLLIGRRDVRRGRSTRAERRPATDQRRWKPTGPISTRPSTASEAVTVPHDVRRPDA